MSEAAGEGAVADLGADIRFRPLSMAPERHFACGDWPVPEQSREHVARDCQVDQPSPVRLRGRCRHPVPGRRYHVEPDGRSPILHLRLFHPLDDHYGLGCLDAAVGAVAIHNAAQRWNKALLDNAARPSGALVYDPGDPGAALSADQFERIKDIALGLAHLLALSSRTSALMKTRLDRKSVV